MRQFIEIYDSVIFGPRRNGRVPVDGHKAGVVDLAVIWLALSLQIQMDSWQLLWNLGRLIGDHFELLALISHNMIPFTLKRHRILKQGAAHAPIKVEFRQFLFDRCRSLR